MWRARRSAPRRAPNRRGRLARALRRGRLCLRPHKQRRGVALAAPQRTHRAAQQRRILARAVARGGRVALRPPPLPSPHWHHSRSLNLQDSYGKKRHHKDTARSKQLYDEADKWYRDVKGLSIDSLRDQYAAPDTRGSALALMAEHLAHVWKTAKKGVSAAAAARMRTAMSAMHAGGGCAHGKVNPYADSSLPSFVLGLVNLQISAGAVTGESDGLTPDELLSMAGRIPLLAMDALKMARVVGGEPRGGAEFGWQRARFLMAAWAFACMSRPLGARAKSMKRITTRDLEWEQGGEDKTGLVLSLVFRYLKGDLQRRIVVKKRFPLLSDTKSTLTSPPLAAIVHTYINEMAINAAEVAAEAAEAAAGKEMELAPEEEEEGEEEEDVVPGPQHAFAFFFGNTDGAYNVDHARPRGKNSFVPVWQRALADCAGEGDSVKHFGEKVFRKGLPGLARAAGASSMDTSAVGAWDDPRVTGVHYDNPGDAMRSLAAQRLAGVSEHALFRPPGVTLVAMDDFPYKATGPLTWSALPVGRRERRRHIMTKMLTLIFGEAPPFEDDWRVRLKWVLESMRRRKAESDAAPSPAMVAAMGAAGPFALGAAGAFFGAGSGAGVLGAALGGVGGLAAGVGASVIGACFGVPRALSSAPMALGSSIAAATGAPVASAAVALIGCAAFKYSECD